MNRIEFGELVATLRKEQFDPITGKCWSQQKLAQKANLLNRTIGSIERGEKKGLDTEIVFGLMDAFQLSEPEKEQFIQIASQAMWDEEEKQEKTSLEDTLPKLLSILPAIETPAIIYDALFFIYGMNSTFRHLHGLEAFNLPLSSSPSYSQNIIWLIFHPDSPLQHLFGSSWESIAQIGVSRLRTHSLPYRHNKAFQDLFAQLSLFPSFQNFWHYHSLDYNTVDTVGPFRYFLSNSQSVKYVATATKISAVPIPLFLVNLTKWNY